MADGFAELTKEKLQTVEGVNELNRMISLLFDNVAGDGDTVKVYRGYGTPESVVSAGMGSIYQRLNGGSGTTLYMKQSGTGATGWVAVESSGVGETNTASNVGSGQGTIFKQKTGVDLELKSLLEGSNIDLTNNASDITVKAIPSGSDTQIQFNDGGTTFGADSDLAWNKTSNILLINGGIAINGAAAVNVTSGVYTPTRSAEANLDSNVTMTEAQYMRVGDVVTVSGRFTADPTLTATTTSFEITLPVASNLGAAEDVAGTATCGNIVSMCAEVIGVVANDTAKVQWKATDVTSQTWAYIFSYQII